MSSSAFVRFPHLMRSLTALVLLIAGQGVTPSFAAAAEPSPGQWFVSLITTYNQKSFCIPATTRLTDVTEAVAQYTQSHQSSGQLTAPIAIQILAQLYPCQAPSTVANAGVPKTDVPKPDDAAAAVGIETIDVMRTLQNTSGHEHDDVLEKIKTHADAYPPPVLFGLARVLFRRGDVDEGIFWFNAARLRGNFDAWRATDVVSARAAMVAISRQMPIELRKAQFADLQKLRAIVTKVITWDETTPRNYDRRWIDFHGVAANKSGPANGKPLASPGTIPPEKWDELAKQVRDEYRQDLEKSIVLMSNAMGNVRK